MQKITIRGISYFSILVILILSLSSLTSAQNKYCKIRFSSFPSKAKIFLNNKLLGKTPFTIWKIKPGKYTLKLTRRNRTTYKEQITISGSKNIFIKLLPIGSKHKFLQRIKTGIQPKEVIFTPDGKSLVITPLWDKKVSLQVYNIKSKTMTNIFLPKYSHKRGFVEGVFNKLRKDFWFTQMSTGMVHVCSYPNFKIKRSFKTGSRWTKVIEFSPDEKTALVSNWLGNNLTRIRTKDYKILKKIPVKAKAPRGIAFTKNNKYYFVVNFHDGYITKFSRKTDKILQRIHTWGANGRIRFDKQSKYGYINNMAFNQLFVLDIKKGKIIKRIRVGQKPNNVRLTPDDQFVYVACRGPNSKKGYLHRSPRNGKIYKISTQDFKVKEIFTGGNQCVGLDISPDGKLLVFSNLKDNTVELYKILQ